MTFVTPGIDPEGRVIVTSRGTTYKIKHIRRNPRVSMLIFGEQYSGSKFVQIHSTAEIIEQARSDGRFDLLVQASARRAQELG
jgi:general stress protein 26